MHLNAFAEGTEPLDMSATEEFASLLQSADDLKIPHRSGARYLSRNTIVRHRRLHFLEWGEPGSPTILLLHGGHQSAHSWDLVSLHLSDRFHVYALDQRGHGDSEWSRDGDYSTDSMAEDAIAFLLHEEIEQPIIFGHSMGGMVTMTLLKRAPTLAQAVVLVDIGPEVSADGTATIRRFIESASEFDDLDEFVARVQAYDPFRTREHIERTVRYNMIQRADGKYVSKNDRSRGYTPQEEGAVNARRITLGDVRTFPCPVLVVRGEQSNVLEADAAERFLQALPKGELVTVSRCGHNVHSQNTLGFLAAIGPFLEAIEA